MDEKVTLQEQQEAPRKYALALSEALAVKDRLDVDEAARTQVFVTVEREAHQLAEAVSGLYSYVCRADGGYPQNASGEVHCARRGLIWISARVEALDVLLDVEGQRTDYALASSSEFIPCQVQQHSSTGYGSFYGKGWIRPDPPTSSESESYGLTLSYSFEDRGADDEKAQSVVDTYQLHDRLQGTLAGTFSLKNGRGRVITTGVVELTKLDTQVRTVNAKDRALKRLNQRFHFGGLPLLRRFFGDGRYEIPVETDHSSKTSLG